LVVLAVERQAEKDQTVKRYEGRTSRDA
jgi:hypothetical protein